MKKVMCINTSKFKSDKVNCPKYLEVCTVTFHGPDPRGVESYKLAEYTHPFYECYWTVDNFIPLEDGDILEEVKPEELIMA